MGRMLVLIRRYKILLALGIIGLIVAAIFSQYSILSIEVANPGAGNIRYEITNQKGGKAISIDSQSRKVRKILPRSNYEVLVSQSTNSSFAVTKTGGFFKKTELKLNLQPEKSRSFVGNNPAPCMVYTKQLYSFECQGLFDTIDIHVPATSVLPTYVMGLPSSAIEGTIEGFLDTDGGIVAIVHPFEIEGPGAHLAYTLNDNLEPIKYASLADLNPEDSYSAVKYRKGFLFYNPDFSHLVYYQSLDASPETIELSPPGEGGLEPILLSADANNLAVVYSDYLPEESNDVIEEQEVRVKNRIMIYGGKKVTEVSFNDRLISSARFCGPSFICVLSEGKMHVLDLSDKKHRTSYSIQGVKALQLTDDGILVVRDKEIIDLEVKSGRGSREYSFDTYEYCGLQPSGQNYLLCLINHREDKLALYVNRSENNSDNIDKKILEISKMPEVSTVSAYGSYIFISPEVGNLVYLDSIKGYGYDPDARKRAADAINERVKSSGIDLMKYQIINTLK